MKTLFPFFLILIFVVTTKAQTTSKAPSLEALMKDPNVLWIGEFYSVFLLDEFDVNKLEDANFLDSIGIKKNRRIKVVPIKNIDTRQKDITEPQEFYFREFIKLETMLEMELYANDSCTQLLSQEEIQNCFKWEVGYKPYNPEEFDDVPEIYYDELNTYDINAYKVKHWVYYDKKNNSINNRVEALAPLVDRYDDNGNFLRKTPLFWMKVEQLPTFQNLNDTAIIWARRVTRTFYWEDTKVLKSTKNIVECLELYIQKITQNYQKEDVRLSYNPYEKHTPDGIRFLKVQVDTIFSAEPDFSKEVQEVQTVESNQFEEKDIHAFRFQQEWYWDYTKRQMQSSVLFFAPVVNRYDDNKNFLNSGPLFWKPTN